MNNECRPADGIINNDGGMRSRYFGLWKDSWTNDSYMWVIGDTVYMSHMRPVKISGKARFAVIEHLNRLGYDMIIPNPDFLMWPEDPSKWGFISYTVKTYVGDVKVWKKPAKE